jgi:hypothetical protein
MKEKTKKKRGRGKKKFKEPAACLGTLSRILFQLVGLLLLLQQERRP